MSRSHEHDTTLVERDGITVRMLSTPEDVTDALSVLDAAEARAAAPLVDESERARLERAAAADAPLREHHHAVLARTTAGCVGYAGLVVPSGDAHAVGDVAIDPDQACGPEVLRALLDAVDGVARRHHAHGTQVWIRQAAASDVLVAVAAGHAVHRRLAVLGRTLHPEVTAAPAPPDGARVRPATSADQAGLVALLAAAYAGSPDAGWDEARFEDATSHAWFRWQDVLVAERTDGPGPLLGVHWTKRRDATTGEVHNLAVAPDAGGRGLGRALLETGLHHLVNEGCDEALLWVDLANESAVRLYTAAGFGLRWEDVSLLRHTASGPRHGHAAAPR